MKDTRNRQKISLVLLYVVAMSMVIIIMIWNILVIVYPLNSILTIMCTIGLVGISIMLLAEMNSEFSKPCDKTENESK